MNGSIFLIQDDGDLVEMREKSYDSEDLLQELLARYPNLLAGEQIDSVRPRKWLLVKREVGIPSEENGLDRWSLDHLFIDQDGIPTLIEVKRSSDTRIRREVVGQMLDYAANAVVYWPVEKIRALFEARCEAQGEEPQKLLEDFLGEYIDSEAFWNQVKTNLQAGKLRLLFVADTIPAELRRIVEFLNAQMNFSEVLAIEVRQYTGQGLKTLVPRVFGQTAAAMTRKGSGVSREKRNWDETIFLSELEDKKGPDAARVAGKILDWGKDRPVLINWGKGKVYGQFWFTVKDIQVKYTLLSMGIDGECLINFKDLRNIAPFDHETKLYEFFERIKQILGEFLPDKVLQKDRWVKSSAITDDAVIDKFLGVLDWVWQELQAASTCRAEK